MAIKTGSMERGLGQEKKYVLKDSMIYIGFKVVKYIEMPKACPQKSMCHFQKLEMILK